LYDRALISLIRYFGTLPCPRCFIRKEDIFWLGTKKDWLMRTENKRVDDEVRRKAVRKARNLLFNKGLNLVNSKVSKSLDALSLHPVEVSEYMVLNIPIY
jgi:hypothetical protein